jgi:hypothetical protein
MSKMRRVTIGVLAGLLGAGCDVPPEESGPAATAPAATRAPAVATPVATVALEKGQQFVIYETGPGELLYSHTGPYGVAPVALPRAILREGDPIKIFTTLAPGKAVPGSLLAAAKRMRAHKQLVPPVSGAGAPSDRGGEWLPAADNGSAPPANEALGMRDVSAWGRTGSSGCPWEFFTLASYDGDQFCPPTTNRSWCERSRAWAFHYNYAVYRAYATVCTDVGVSVLKVSTGSTTTPIAEFWVNAGTWQYVFTNTFGYPMFKKFDLTDTGFGPAVAHFGGIFELSF